MAGKSAKISSKSKSHPGHGRGMGSFFYNSDEGTVLGRTAGSWIKIIVFYIIYYICLAAFFCLNYYLFSRTLIENEPKWKLGESLIGTNPGVGFRPVPDQDANAESTLIWYNHKTTRDADFWHSQLDKFVKEAELPEDTPGVVNCEIGGESSSASKSCRVRALPDDKKCTADKSFGYLEAKPCVLVKLNKIYGWQPEPFGIDENGKYDSTLLQIELDEYVQNNEMPRSLVDEINRQVQADTANAAEILKTVWFSCQGENVGDQESLPDQAITYEPLQGIRGYYFPYLNQKNYKSPYVMVHLDIPDTSRHTLINVECRAWAKNIKHDKIARLGSVHLEVMVD